MTENSKNATTRNWTRRLAWIAAACLFGFAAVRGEAFFRSVRSGDAALPGAITVGGPFELVDADGKPFPSSKLEGRPFAIFFGYTHCPDVCPTTLMEMTNHLAKLGADGERLRIVFVTIDPARDTAPYLKTYLTAFDPRIAGLTGSEPQVTQIAKAFRIFYQKEPGKDGEYTMNHTATVFLMDGNGRFAGTLSYQEEEGVQLAKLRRLIAR